MGARREGIGSLGAGDPGSCKFWELNSSSLEKCSELLSLITTVFS